jgi:hypothetical protein
LPISRLYKWNKLQVLEVTLFFSMWLKVVVVAGLVPVAHTCNPRYSAGRDQEDHGLMPTWENSSQDPISEKTYFQKGLVEWLKV